MNKSRQLVCKTVVLFLCLISADGVFGQKETKTFTESFSVANDAVLYIDTKHADIEFETWKKDEVEVEAIVEIEGADAEAVKRYFEREGFDILGNSSKVEIKTRGGNAWVFDDAPSVLHNFKFEMPELPEVIAMEDFDNAFEIMELPEIAEMPELPRNAVPHFDYEAFKEDKEGYMKEWKKAFDKNFGEDYQERMEKWAEKMERRQEERAKRREEFAERMEKRAEERAERREEMVEERAKRLEEAQKRREEQAERRVNRNKSIHISRDDSGEPSIFYFNSEGENKNYKVKKTIKIKMPKGMKIKMNVRHGEVKLADNIWHMDAKLSHASLWAASIDGDKTTIKASYSPVNVDRWYLGNLQANYSESVNLKEVFDITLNTTSSNVNIDKLIKKAFIKNDFGQLSIGDLARDFTDLDVTLQNAELEFGMPKVPFDIYVNSSSSKFSCPAGFTLERTKNPNNIIHKGYHLKKGERAIMINSKYSEVQIN